MSAIPEGSAPRQAGERRERDFGLDLLRAIAILEVIFAHSRLPPLVDQLRNFGVPFLILLSGMAFVRASDGQQVRWLPHMGKRLERLIVPTWIFLAGFFLANYLIAELRGKRFAYDWPTIADTFALGIGIGYVWVIRVNLLVSMAAPFLLRLYRATENAGYLAGCAAIFGVGLLLNDGPWRIAAMLPDWLDPVYAQTLPYLFPFAGLFALGMRIDVLPRWVIAAIAAACLASFAWMALAHMEALGKFRPTQIFKYPPRGYYLSYALCVSLLLLLARDRLAALFTNRPLRALVFFIGGNTLWIYLWHIPGSMMAARMLKNGMLPDHFLATWIAVSVIAIGATWLQKTLVGLAARGIPEPARRHVLRIAGG